MAAYDTAASAFAAEWQEQPAPTDLHDLVRRFFKPGRTADIGSGSGREVAWLALNGFDALGYEPSRGLREEAQRRYPALCFEGPALPTRRLTTCCARPCSCILIQRTSSQPSRGSFPSSSRAVRSISAGASPR